MSDEKIIKHVKRNKITLALLCIALLVAVVLGGFGGYKIARLLTPASPEVETDQIREEVEPVLMAVSYKYNFTEILHHSDSMNVKLPVLDDLLKNNYVATIEGTAFIGIDMESDASAVKYEVVKASDGTLQEVKITMPKSEVFAVDIDEDSIEVYEDRGALVPLVNDISKEDVQKLRKKMRKEQIQQVKDNDLLRLSDERIREIVTAQIKSAHGEDVEVNIEFVDKA